MASSQGLLTQKFPQSYQAIHVTETEGDIETDSSSSCKCLTQQPVFRPSWPVSFINSSALIVRAPPTQSQLSNRVCFDSYRNRHRAPSFKTVTYPTIGQRARGYSDDAPILRVKLPMFDAKLSDITWLHKGTQYAAMKKKLKKEEKKKQKLKLKSGGGDKGGAGLSHGAAEEENPMLKNHPTVRKFRDQYSNWRKGSAKGATGELTNDRLDGFTVGGEEAEVTEDVDQLPEEQIKEIADKIDGSSDSLSSGRHYSPSNLSSIVEIPPYESMNQTSEVEEEEEVEVKEEGVSLMHAVFNGLNASNLSVVILVTPFLMRQIGFMFIPMVLLIFLVSVHTLDLLDRCQERTGSLSFPDVATAAFGTSGRWFAAAMCYFDLYAACVGCMIITAHSLDMIVFTFTGYQMGDSNSKIITTIAYVPTCFLKDLSVVSYLSMGGLVATLFAIALILVFFASSKTENTEEPSPSFVGPNPFIPISLVLYQFCMHSLYPSLRASMARPKEAPQMTRIVLGIVASLVVIFSSSIYMILGASVPEIITTELGTSMMGVAINTLVIFSCVGKVPLSLLSLSDALSELYAKKLAPRTVASGIVVTPASSFLVRIEVLIITLLSCVFVTGYLPWLQFVCWIFTPLLMVVMPIACYLTLFNKHEMSRVLRFIYKCVMAVAVIVCLIGVESICASMLKLKDK